MNIEKAKKRISKQVKKGFNGYPLVSLEYFGKTADCATEVVISFTLDENTKPQEQKFESKNEIRDDETIQSAIVKILERTNANTVTESDSISIVN